MFQGFLILCVISIIGASPIPTFVLATVEEGVESGNDSTIVNGLSNKGLALDKLGNYSEAIKYYSKVLAIRPNNTNTLDNIGIDLNNLGNYTGTVEYFNRALAINPKDETALYNKGAALYHLGFPTL